METLKIVKDQPFVLWIPTIMLNADGEQEIDASTLTDVVVTASSGCDKYTIGHHAYEHWLVLEFDDSLKIGPYRITITGVLNGGRKFCLALAKPLEIVNWDSESNWDRFIVGDHIELTDHPFITGEFLTDAELEALKAELREKITDAEQAKADAEAAKEHYDELAEQLSGVAQQTTLTQGISDIRGDISHIDIDTTKLAKETSVKDGNDTAIGVAKEVRSEVGTGSDTASESGTLFAVVKWTKDKIKDVYALIGYTIQEIDGV